MKSEDIGVLIFVGSLVVGGVVFLFGYYVGKYNGFIEGLKNK